MNTKTVNGKTKLVISQSEWEEIGEQQGWDKQDISPRRYETASRAFNALSSLIKSEKEIGTLRQELLACLENALTTCDSLADMAAQELNREW